MANSSRIRNHFLSAGCNRLANSSGSSTSEQRNATSRSCAIGTSSTVTARALTRIAPSKLGLGMTPVTPETCTSINSVRRNACVPPGTETVRALAAVFNDARSPTPSGARTSMDTFPSENRCPIPSGLTPSRENPNLPSVLTKRSVPPATTRTSTRTSASVVNRGGTRSFSYACNETIWAPIRVQPYGSSWLRRSNDSQTSPESSRPERSIN